MSAIDFLQELKKTQTGEYAQEWLDDAIKALEQEPIDKPAMMIEIYMQGVNMAGEYQGCWVRFKDIEKIVDKYIAESDEQNLKMKQYSIGNVLDKIRAEIEQNAYPIVHGVNNHEKGMTLYGILQIIDKYRKVNE